MLPFETKSAAAHIYHAVYRSLLQLLEELTCLSSMHGSMHRLVGRQLAGVCSCSLATLSRSQLAAAAQVKEAAAAALARRQAEAEATQRKTLPSLQDRASDAAIASSQPLPQAGQHLAG